MSNADITYSAHAPAQEPTPSDSLSGRPRPPPSRRRDKPQLSCNACRRRNRGSGSSCTYTTATGRPHGPVHVQDRINELESLVVSLMRQQNPARACPPSSEYTVQATPDEVHVPEPSVPGGNPELPGETTPMTQLGISPPPSDCGSIKVRESGVSYVSSAHWAAVLDSIAELRQHFAEEDEAYARIPDPIQSQASLARPQLFYISSTHISHAEVLHAIPPRPVVDRLVSRYFNVVDLATGIVHSGKFLREYEGFWNRPQETPIVWVGLLLAIICVSTQLQETTLVPHSTSTSSGTPSQPTQDPQRQAMVDTLRKKIAQCLVLGHYAKGGPHVLETLILYLLFEILLSKGVETGIWVLAGNIAQIAIHMGYHRDAKHFPDISPFAGEMRRRVWTTIAQIDYSSSLQMGLPTVIKESQVDTAEPRNLYDADFDEDTTNLPPSRPESEVTPILYVLSKHRLLSVSVKVADMAIEPRSHSYSEVLDLDKQIDKARDALPLSMRWKSLASSLDVPSQVLMKRIWLEVSLQRLKVDLHRKFMGPSRLQQEHAYSRSACLAAAMRILEFQHLVDEEARVDGRLNENHWRVSTSLLHEFLLATSILCFYLQNRGAGPQEQSVGPGDAGDISVDRIKRLLRASQVIWARSSATSRAARKAVAALRYVLGDSGASAGSSSGFEVSDSGVSSSAPTQYFPDPAPPGPETDRGEKDVAMEMVGTESHAIDPVVIASAVRKIDWFLIPAMMFGYGLVYYDKAILGSAVLFGMTSDLELSVPDPNNPGAVDTSRLSWATSLFYFGMLAGLYPMSFALQRLDLGRVLGGVVCVWAATCAATAGVTSHGGLYAQRFFLGFVESIIPTGFMCIVSGFYTQAEQSLRQSWWFSSTGLWTILGGALNYGFAQITGGGLRRWQYIYLLAGALTFLFGLFCFAAPSSPVSAWFLTKEERFAAVERLRYGQTGVRCTKFKWAQLREAVLDVKIWLIALMMASAYTVNGAVSGFGPLIVSTFGWSTLNSILFQFPLGGLCFIVILLTGWLGSRIPNIRILMLIICCLPVIAGCAIIWKSEWTFHAAAPVIGYTITGTFGGVVSLIITIGMSNVAGHTKKSFTSATIFVAYCVGNIIGPQLVRSQSKAHHYPELWLGLIICYCITILSSAALYIVLQKENKRREATVVEDETERSKLAFQDLTDKENPYFRYVM
ncbi:hypothetical protein DL770_001099 [Monosporascus sp. CRB-9-2]|nr:hypothetical protein DL770_001099 [Monosporascus sp. CRB-9-2]